MERSREKFTFTSKGEGSVLDFFIFLNSFVANPFICQVKTQTFHIKFANEKSEAIAYSRRCRSSRLARWWAQKRIIGKNGEAQGVADSKNTFQIKSRIAIFSLKPLYPGGIRTWVFCSWSGWDIHAGRGPFLKDRLSANFASRRPIST
jgi:hypothetical protein